MHKVIEEAVRRLGVAQKDDPEAGLFYKGRIITDEDELVEAMQEEFPGPEQVLLPTLESTASVAPVDTTELEDKVKNLTTEVTTLQREKADLATRLQTSEGKVATLSEEKSTLGKQLKESQAKVKDLEKAKPPTPTQPTE